VFANAYMFIYSPRRGTPAARWEQVAPEIARERFQRLAQAQNTVSRAYHEGKVGSTVRALVQGPSKKDARKLAAKSLDNATVIAPMPPDYDASHYAREPWLDIQIEHGYIWGCTGTIVRRADRFTGAGVCVERPIIDLVSA
jgi:tRNA-2-methylthio-N6-dimethylallyladenosine synthase